MNSKSAVLIGIVIGLTLAAVWLFVRDSELAPIERSVESVPESMVTELASEPERHLKLESGADLGARADEPLEEGAEDAPPTAPVEEALSALALRYPHLADQVVVNGVALAEIDLETCDPELFSKYLLATLALAREIEAGILEDLVGLQDMVIGLSAARELYNASPDSYIAEVNGSLARGRDNLYVDLSGVLPQELVEARMLTVELSNHPRNEAYQVEEAHSVRSRTFADEDGVERYYPLDVARWERERFGQHFVGYGADGRSLVKIVNNWAGVPF
jgi:hypothetical protein